MLRRLCPVQPLCKVGKHGIYFPLSATLAKVKLSAEKFDKPVPVAIGSVNIGV